MARPGARRARLGGFWELGEASGELRGRFPELWGGHLEASETILRNFKSIFWRFGRLRGQADAGLDVPGGRACPGRARPASKQSRGTTLGDLGADFLGS